MKLIEINGYLRLPKDVRGEYDDNLITSFKGRTIETECQIEVYRNLNRKGKVYSIKQQGLVVAHTTSICMFASTFVVNQSGKKRAIETKQRNVHAFIRGFYATNVIGLTSKDRLPITIMYKPFDKKGFCNNTGKEYSGARYCIINEYGVSASNLY